MSLPLLVIVIYLAAGLAMVIWDLRKVLLKKDGSNLLEPPLFIRDRSVSTALVFILIWPYKILRKL